MSLIKKTGAVSTVLLTTALVAVTTAPAAHAAVGDTAPDCVARYVDGYPSSIYVALTNNCGTTKKVKVDIRWGSDSPCWSLKSGAKKEWWYEGLGSYRKTVLC
ncbi:hypothetical protein [Streptomyces sp. PTY087I2]|uniref:hypothetical protein n=1 Tax=Streptomyces sp. PTY087I2 TaxID=1819298 RepID=UPI00080BDEE1|nr:hypothetical protein [Streptomyces sp. PTY087I2]OCC11321.1 hypothetical protein A3Q37_03013 [Streptomyces sp. PTY087I2]